MVPLSDSINRSFRRWHVSDLGFGLGPGLGEFGDDVEVVADEGGVFFDVRGYEVLVDGEVDVGELGGVFPGVEVEGVEEGDEEVLGVDEVCVGGLVCFEGVEGSFEVEGEALEYQDDEFGWRRCGDRVVTVCRCGVLVGVLGHC